MMFVKNLMTINYASILSEQILKVLLLIRKVWHISCYNCI
ncbi:hypothetical protein MTR67_046330 [Solanum verrucosum]|uniref:Uncharacterized protein n=1 Tax=Solanum verrucosum TaxID=315347 RepID=A0AAF0UUC4_SOLVR|nr:hypothetical protein MTR67_046330 [Solanum verrucosum]